jgi:hypothetical protein
LLRCKCPLSTHSRHLHKVFFRPEKTISAVACGPCAEQAILQYSDGGSREPGLGDRMASAQLSPTEQSFDRAFTWVDNQLQARGVGESNLSEPEQSVHDLSRTQDAKRILAQGRDRPLCDRGAATRSAGAKAELRAVQNSLQGSRAGTAIHRRGGGTKIGALGRNVRFRPKADIQVGDAWLLQPHAHST